MRGPWSGLDQHFQLPRGFQSSRLISAIPLSTVFAAQIVLLSLGTGIGAAIMRADCSQTQVKISRAD